MKICPKCKNENKENIKFCTGCGTKLNYDFSNNNFKAGYEDALNNNISDFGEIEMTDSIVAYLLGAEEGKIAKEIYNAGNIKLSNSIDFETYKIKYRKEYIVGFDIGKNITDIPENGFSGCKSIKNIVIPSNVVSIGKYAFRDCDNLTEIEIPETVESIEDYAFLNSINLKKVILNRFYKNIKNIFDDRCKTEIVINNITSLPESAFKDCKFINSVILSDSLTEINKSTFEGCVNLTEINMPKDVHTVEENAFADCKSLKSVKFPDKLTEIKEKTFTGCEELCEISFPDSLKIIRNNAFEGCGFINITITKNIESIEDYAFSYCEKLKKVTVLSKVSALSKKAFWGCNTLSDFICCEKFIFSRDNSKEISVPDEGIIELEYYLKKLTDYSLSAEEYYDLEHEIEEAQDIEAIIKKHLKKEAINTQALKYIRITVFTSIIFIILLIYTINLLS